MTDYWNLSMENTKSTVSYMGFFVLCLILSACGGSGSDNSAAANTTRTITNTQTGDQLTIADLSWNTPTERENGDALTPGADIRGYVVRYRLVGSDNQEYSYLDLEGFNVTEVFIEDLAAGDYEFNVATVGSDGLQGAYSNSVYITLET